MNIMMDAKQWINKSHMLRKTNNQILWYSSHFKIPPPICALLYDNPDILVFVLYIHTHTHLEHYPDITVFSLILKNLTYL